LCTNFFKFIPNIVSFPYHTFRRLWKICSMVQDTEFTVAFFPVYWVTCSLIIEAIGDMLLKTINLSLFFCCLVVK
jgi:hypothetical protein